MATYLITAIDTETIRTHTFIARMLIHLTENGKVHKGKVMTKGEVLVLMKQNEVYTGIWNYTKIAWDSGERVSSEVRNGQTYLRTNPDSTRRDNLLHLLPLPNLGF